MRVFLFTTGLVLVLILILILGLGAVSPQPQVGVIQNPIFRRLNISQSST